MGEGSFWSLVTKMLLISAVLPRIQGDFRIRTMMDPFRCLLGDEIGLGITGF
jgi:hypothetical protein